MPSSRFQKETRMQRPKPQHTPMNTLESLSDTQVLKYNQPKNQICFHYNSKLLGTPQVLFFQALTTKHLTTRSWGYALVISPFLQPNSVYSGYYSWELLFIHLIYPVLTGKTGKHFLIVLRSAQLRELKIYQAAKVTDKTAGTLSHATVRCCF